MDSSSLLQLQSQRVNQSNEDPQLSVSKGLEFDCSMPEYDRFNSTVECHEDKHLADVLCDSEQPKMDELKLSIPMPNFLIDPQDGQFTPYFERSPVSTPDHEFDGPNYFEHANTSRDSSPDSVMSPLRSRATSIALKKLMETQAQMLLDISAAWKKKYPVDFSYEPRSVANDDGSSVASNHCIRQSSTSQINSLLPANSILPASQTPRKNRSMSQRSSASLVSLVDRLSLRDPSKTTLSADVESWKRDALQSKLKEQSTRSWIDCLPLSDEFEDPSESL
ncbi:hypothetical protein PGT21_013203 [Puccinia graminis f. sp. tritici]|uniref:Uncharacterized protein n=2 Tax=Puccinia graminis f. sp. tritici TaxID=56615 RepID=E3KHW0_PUCGT|nr:uncharacterized protein PGTG_09598 [Puccinia graminis f. sp. tritici CRL 75-36-700-3]EFP83885.1 hypothetical protein PGTG_09598 [Puccinia graminis f. sp. tritici CRL 75-36-700-3]KAA1064742.1 hypothetical protein PGT21_013203 [Puccinia graminis f. sp. tritici]